MLKELNMRLIAQGLDIFFADSLKNWILAEAYDEEFGARPIARFITKTVETFIATKIISGELKPQLRFNPEEDGERHFAISRQRLLKWGYVNPPSQFSLRIGDEILNFTICCNGDYNLLL